MPTFKNRLSARGRIVPGNERGDPIEAVGYDPAWPTGCSIVVCFGL